MLAPARSAAHADQHYSSSKSSSAQAVKSKSSGGGGGRAQRELLNNIAKNGSHPTGVQTSMGSTQDDEEDLIEQLNRKLSNVTLNPTTSIPDEMNISDISTMLPTFAQPLQNLLASGVYQQQLLAMVRIRKYLSLQDVLPRIDNVLALDCIRYFIQFLNMTDYPDLQYETAWVVTNIAAGSTAQTDRLVQAGILKPLIHNLHVSRCVHVQTQTIWALGNISGDGPPYRDLILKSGALEVIMSMIEMCEDPNVPKEQKYMILRIAVWCVSNLCRGSGQYAPDWLQVTPAFPMLRRLMYIDDPEILADTCWAMCRILNGTHRLNLENVSIDRELCARFVALLGEPHPTIQVPSLRSLINIASGPEHHTQLLIDAMAIPVLGSEALLHNSNSTIRRDALLGISNITAGTAEQVREVTLQDNGNVMRRVMEILRQGDISEEDNYLDEDDVTVRGGDWRVLREAAWVVSNATSVLDLEITGHLVYTCELLTSIAQLIDPRNHRQANYLLPALGLLHAPLLTKLLDVVFNVLRCNEHHPKEQFMKIWVIDCGGGHILLELLKLTSLQLDKDSVSRYEPPNEMSSKHMLPRSLGPVANGFASLSLSSPSSSPSSHSSIRNHHTNDANMIGGLPADLIQLTASVRKRVETILENFFEFGDENEGFGPFFSERPNVGDRPKSGTAEPYGDDDYYNDLDDQDAAYYGIQRGNGSNGGRNGGNGRSGRGNDEEFDIVDRVQRMNLS